MRWRCLALGGVAGFILVACNTNPLAPPPLVPPLDISQVSSEGPYSLGADDEIRIVVYGQPDLSTDYKLDDSGQISVPLIGAVDALGLNARELEARLTERLSQGFLVDPSVNVEITSYQPIYILGEVNQAGRYDFQNNMNIIAAISIAGGYTEDAVTSIYKVTRTVDGVAVQGRGSQSTIVKPGDVVEVLDIELVDKDILTPEELNRQ